jgi:HAMP domain-containing protein
MKIKTKLQLIIIANILILAGVVCLSLLWQKQAEDLIGRNVMISELQEVIFERARLREEYFLHRTDRAKAQFLLIHKEIGVRLERMSKAFHDPEEKASLDGMIVAHLRIGHLFDRLVRLDERTGDRPAGTGALRERIISQMLVGAHLMYRDGAKLLKAANEKTANQNDRVRLYGYITFGLLALLIGAFAVIIIRNIAYPLTRLQEGTEMVARGNLSYKTDLGTRDEIGFVT